VTDAGILVIVEGGQFPATDADGTLMMVATDGHDSLAA